MKTITIITTAIIATSIFSCKEKQEQIEVKNADEHIMHASQNLDVKVDNKIDPICEMETAGHVSDTIHYDGKIYGFCSSGCKEEFSKNPQQYLSKLGN
ncbi:YHS domain-containing protein [Moheibacter sediminis]|uniref:YHS domain-containing protein n=1 Tax=Moheibacter sediminis TaxID=1434700 RepID=A0A1W1ZPS3_9FLAO|nr:YHS domain-containing protein [Moheibacter sediminis]SMC50419.1 YHS domain-containing protein [Moheibacter sediminis]